MRELWTKSRWLVLTSAAIGLLAFGLSGLGAPRLAREALALAPAGTALVARVNVPAVTSSHLWRALLEEDRDRVRQVERVCGYDPLARVDEVFVLVSGTAERPFDEVGFVARGEMARGRENRERLVACVGEVVGGRGGLRRLEVEGVPALASSSGGSHAAFVGEDGVVGGDREVVAGVLRVARGADAAVSDPVLARLWSRVSADRDVVVVARLPERWMPAMQRMSRQVEGDLASLASLRAIAVGAGLSDGLALGVAVETEGAASAQRLAGLAQSQVESLLTEPLVRLSAVGRAVRRIRVEAQGPELVLTASVREPEIDALLALWRRLRAEPPPALEGEPSPEAASEAASVVDDEPAEP